jgi:hypothetical protein
MQNSGAHSLPCNNAGDVANIKPEGEEDHGGPYAA